MQTPVTLQTALEYVECLSVEEQNLLIELLQKRQTEQRRLEIANNSKQTLAAVQAGTAKGGTFEDLKADLLAQKF
ncbi:MAG: hypothetical protein F6J96_00320 [Symploca sp. SIO1C2]|nr:hypothetical protein [Symploca sp. SIO1C2]